MISESLLCWSLAAIGLFWSVGAYNRLVRLRSCALQSFAALAVPMQRAVEIVQSCQPDPTTVDSTPTWARLLGAQVQFSASLAVARTRPLDAAAIHALAAADTVLQMAWLEASSENGDVVCTTLAESTRIQWIEARQLIRPATRAFAEVIQNYNSAIAQFPALLLARLFGFRKATSLPNDF